MEARRPAAATASSGGDPAGGGLNPPFSSSARPLSSPQHAADRATTRDAGAPADRSDEDKSDAATGDMARAMTVDIRGNTDDSWTRGMRYILKNGIFSD